MRCCGQPISKIDNCWLCTICGSVSSFLVMQPSYSEQPMPTRVPYSRLKRFQRVFANVFGLRIAKVDDNLLKDLSTVGQELKTPSCLFKLIKGFTCRSYKRYDAVSLFSVLFLGHTIKPVSDSERVVSVARFRDVESSHEYQGGTFPAYSWLIEKILILLGRHELIQYVHCLKCPKRRRLYEQQYGMLFKKHQSYHEHNHLKVHSADSLLVARRSLPSGDTPVDTKERVHPPAKRYEKRVSALLQSLADNRFALRERCTQDMIEG